MNSSFIWLLTGISSKLTTLRSYPVLPSHIKQVWDCQKQLWDYQKHVCDYLQQVRDFLIQVYGISENRDETI